MTYEDGQASVLFKHWPKEAKYFILGGVADANEAQTVKEQFPEVTCIGFEPDKKAIETQKIYMNFPGDIYPYALWYENTNLILRLMGDNNRSSRVFDFTRDNPYSVVDIENHGSVKVEAKTLDSLSEELGPWSDVVLWLDIEYSEIAALVGAKELLRSISLLNVEVTQSHLNIPRFIRLLGPYGFSLVECWNAKRIPSRVDAIFKKGAKCSTERQQRTR